VTPGGAQPRLGVVMPLANEEATIEALLRDVTARLEPHDRVYCVLDGASRDRTRALVEAAGIADPRIELVWAEHSRCAVDAYFAGYRRAHEQGCRWILEMDGGFSHEPAAIPLFVAAMESGADYAGGTRFAHGGEHVGSIKRTFVSWTGTVLANTLLGTRMSDMTSGFECFSRDALGLVLRRGVRSRAHFFQTEIRTLMHDLRWVEVPIRYRNPSPRLGASSVTDALRTLWSRRRERREGARS
jgi:dolichol-phosphate mannosyltransferase